MIWENNQNVNEQPLTRDRNGCARLRQNITQSLVNRLFSPIDLHIADTKIPGFHIRYYAKTGRKVFYQNYTVRFTRRQRNMHLGVHGELSVAMARFKATVVRQNVHDGADPMQELRDRTIVRKYHSFRRSLTKDVLEEYLEKCSRIHKRVSTYESDCSKVRNYVVPMIGRVRLTDLTLVRMQDFYDGICKRSTASNANKVFALMSHFWNWCERREYLPLNSNPCRHVERVRYSKRIFKRLNIEEYGRLFVALDYLNESCTPINVPNARQHNPAFSIIKLLALTGCRCGEIKNLKRSEVDLKNHFIRLADSKTGAKSVPLGQAAVEVLDNIIERAVSDGWTGKYVFPSPRNADKPLYDLRKPWSRVLKHAGLEGLRIHDLRHSFATMGIQMGQDLFTIKNILGHTKISTTEIYAKSNELLQLRGADAITAAITGQTPPPQYDKEEK